MATCPRSAVPRLSARHSDTPCQSGVRYATGWSQPGSWVIGKNTPENRNSGIMKNRKIMANELSLVRVTDHASIGVANASPVSTATGSAAIIHGERTAPSTDATAMKIPQFMVSRISTNSRWPWNTSAGRSGEADAAWYVLVHLTEANTG